MRRSQRLCLPGRFLDAYLYFDFAWLFSKDGVVRAFDLARYCEERLNGEGVASRALFSNNQLLPSLIENGNPTAPLAKLLQIEGSIDVDPNDIDRFSYIFETHAACRSILDVRFYNGRAFVGVDDGIRQFVALGRSDLQESELGQSATTTLRDQRVSDRPARQIQSRYGAIAAACGPSGGVLGVGAGSDDRDWRIEFEAFAERSYGIEINGNAVSNLSSSTAVELYAVENRASKRETHSADDEQERIEVARVTGRSFTAQSALLNRFISDLAGPAQTFLFKQTLWVLASDGFHRFKLAEHDAITVPKPVGTAALPRARVLSTAVSAAGVMLETDDEVLLFNGKSWTTLVDEPVHSVRGYPSSKRYKRLVTAVTRERAELIALI